MSQGDGGLILTTEIVEAAEFALLEPASCQHLAQICLAEARQNRSNRQVDGHFFQKAEPRKR